MHQKTIKEKVKLAGIGIHSGDRCNLIFHPADENHGITFLVNGAFVPAHINYVFSTARGTALKNNDQTIMLTEHLLAAGYALGITNLIIEMSSSEPPGVDGSALPFVLALQSGKIVKQAVLGKELYVEEKIEVAAIAHRQTATNPTEKSSITTLPHRGLKISFEIDFKIAGSQFYEIEISEESFIAEIAPARTFGYVTGLDELKKRGLARGASLENALAIGETGYINSPRFADELVRHKILDLIGDLALLGYRINAELRCKKSGHQLNYEIGKKLLSAKL